MLYISLYQSYGQNSSSPECSTETPSDQPNFNQISTEWAILYQNNRPGISPGSVSSATESTGARRKSYWSPSLLRSLWTNLVYVSENCHCEELSGLGFFGKLSLWGIVWSKFRKTAIIRKYLVSVSENCHCEELSGLCFGKLSLWGIVWSKFRKPAIVRKCLVYVSENCHYI